MLHENAMPYGNIVTDKELYFTQFIDWPWILILFIDNIFLVIIFNLEISKG
jgi:hypothetical protein